MKLLEFKICTEHTTAYMSVKLLELTQLCSVRHGFLTQAQERKLEVADMRMVVLDVWANKKGQSEK